MKPILLFIATLVLLVGAQDYGEYARGHGMARRNNRGPLAAGVFGGVAGVMLGGMVTGRKLKKKWNKEKKDILQYVQAQDEIYRNRDTQWQAEYQKLYKAYQQMEQETLERDYEEFKAPDANGDDMITRAEFNTYVRKYLASFPELSEKDFPKFDEFDLDGDGIVSFEEWQRFLQQQKLQEAQGKGTGSGSKYGDLLQQLYADSHSQDASFSTLQNRRGR